MARTGVRYSTDHSVGRHTRTGSHAGEPTPVAIPRPCPSKQTPPGARNQNSPLESLPACVRYGTVRSMGHGHVSSGDGVLGAGWADSQRSIAGCLSYLKKARSPPFSSSPPFPISMQEEWKRGPRTECEKTGTFLFVPYMHGACSARLQARKIPGNASVPQSPPSMRFGRPVSQQGLAFGTKFANFICRASSIASQVPLRVRSTRTESALAHCPYCTVFVRTTCRCRWANHE